MSPQHCTPCSVIENLFRPDERKQSSDLTLTPSLEKSVSKTESTSEMPEKLLDLPIAEFQAPPTDSGRGAWTYLIAAFVLETIVWGYASAFGVLLDFYNNKEVSQLGQEPNAGTLLSLVGTANSGIMAFLSPFICGIITRYPDSRKLLMAIGLLICFISIFSSSYATSCVAVLWSQGIGYGVGGAALYYPGLAYLPEWFVARQGLANGIIFAGTGLGGLIFPFLLDVFLYRLGVKVTLQIMACAMTLLLGICVLLIRPRITTLPAKDLNLKTFEQDTPQFHDPVDAQPRNLWPNIKGAVRWPFMLYQLSSILQSLGYYIPCLYLPSYAHSLSLGPSWGSATLAALNAGGIIARIVGGTLSDHYSPHLIGSVTSLIGGTSALVFWGVFGNRGPVPLMLFSFIFGCTAGAWTGLFFGVVQVWLRNPQLTMAAYGVISATRGLSNIMAGPISSALISSTKTKNEVRTGFDVDSYSKTIWLSGLSLIGTFMLEMILWLIK